jgi:alpha-acetolactate decarboxylase
MNHAAFSLFKFSTSWLFSLINKCDVRKTGGHILEMQIWEVSHYINICCTTRTHFPLSIPFWSFQEQTRDKT